MARTTTDPAVAQAFTLPVSLLQRLEAERQRQGVGNRSLFFRLALEAYVSKCEQVAAA